jgi:hypothetical protein
MAENLPINFTVPPETVPTYNAIDAALGVGYARYYGVASKANYFLSPVVSDSDNIGIDGQDRTYTTGKNTVKITYEKVIDIDFDLLFKFPQVIEGRAILSFTVIIPDNGVVNTYQYVIAKLYHVNNSAVENLIGSYGSDAIAIYNSTGADIDYRRTYDIDCPKTSFSIGEKLRLTMEVWANDNSALGDYIDHYIYHDGSNRVPTASGHDTDIILDVPYRINL